MSFLLIRPAAMRFLLFRPVVDCPEFLGPDGAQAEGGGIFAALICRVYMQLWYQHGQTSLNGWLYLLQLCCKPSSTGSFLMLPILLLPRQDRHSPKSNYRRSQSQQRHPSWLLLQREKQSRAAPVLRLSYLPLAPAALPSTSSSLLLICVPCSTLSVFNQLSLCRACLSLSFPNEEY